MSLIDKIFGPIPEWQDATEQVGTDFAGKGFNVLLRNPSTADKASSDLVSDDIYGFAFAGHGAGGGQLVFDPANGNSLQAHRITTHGIAFLSALGCSTAEKQSHSSISPKLTARMGYEYSAWEKNVAKGGVFVGVYAVANGRQAWSKIVTSPGTNTQ